MTATSVPWLWLYGPSGAGKTAVGWELFTRLAASGYRVGYVEIDQLGICLPPEPGDPGNDAVKATNLVSVLENFRAAGADGVVVSGDIAGAAMDDVLRRSGHPGPALCRLRAQPTSLRARLRTRGAPPTLIDAAATYAHLDPTAGHLMLDTDALTVGQVADEIQRRLGTWPAHKHGPVSAPVPAPGPVSTPPSSGALLVCGPAAVGKSAVAWEVFPRSVAAGVSTAYLDLAQIGFLRPAGNHDPLNHNLKARNVAQFLAVPRQNRCPPADHVRCDRAER